MGLRSLLTPRSPDEGSEKPDEEPRPSDYDLEEPADREKRVTSRDPNPLATETDDAYHQRQEREHCRHQRITSLWGTAFAGAAALGVVTSLVISNLSLTASQESAKAAWLAVTEAKRAADEAHNQVVEMQKQTPSLIAAATAAGRAAKVAEDTLTMSQRPFLFTSLAIDRTVIASRSQNPSPEGSPGATLTIENDGIEPAVIEKSDFYYEFRGERGPAFDIEFGDFLPLAATPCPNDAIVTGPNSLVNNVLKKDAPRAVTCYIRLPNWVFDQITGASSMLLVGYVRYHDPIGAVWESKMSWQFNASYGQFTEIPGTIIQLDGRVQPPR